MCFFFEVEKMFVKDENHFWSSEERAKEAMKVKMRLFPGGLSSMTLTEREAANRAIENEVNKAEAEAANLQVRRREFNY